MDTRPVNQATLGARRYDLDWVRICAFGLLIFYHVGMYYVTWDWHVKSPYASTTVEPLMLLTSPWRLSLLFLISGVATAYLLERRGKERRKGFLGRRSIRLLTPLIFGMAVIVPPQSYLEVVEKLSYAGSYLDFLKLYFSAYHGFCRGSDCLILPTWNHLWFVAYLWVYTVVLYALVRVTPKLTQWLRNILERAFSGTGVLIWPVAFLAMARIALIDAYPPNHALVGDWYNHVTYGMTFLLGFALAGTHKPWLALERVRWTALVLAILGWAFLVTYMSVYGADSSPTPPYLLMLFRRVVFGTEQWLAIAAVLGFARRYLNHDNAARRYLTTAIFPVYILHQTIIVVAAHALKSVNLTPSVEGPLLIAVTAVSCLAGYEVIRRVAILRPLFGLASSEREPPASADGRPAARQGAAAAISSRKTGAPAAPRLVPQDVH
ncbi:MAG: acyltransferase family protein [Proteobacteria bacterium]|nr:acyltransferase family protein [Pseudomonadota bacterium]